MYMKNLFYALLICLPATSACATVECQQPVAVVNIANIACVDPYTGAVAHNNYKGNYKLDIFSDDETNNWYRGDFYGLDDD
jgi:hypothetical protein